MSKRYEWLYNETMLKHYMVDNLNNNQLGYESVVNLLNQQNQKILELEEQSIRDNEIYNEQLAEKEKEISVLKSQLCLSTISQGIDQDKISFAVEQLKIAQKYIQQYVNNFDDMNDCLYEIDNQIKQLKEMK